MRERASLLPRRARDDEEECTRAIAMPSEALLQIGIDRDELQTIVEWQEDIGDDDVAKEEAQDQLHIAHIHLLHHPWHRDEGHTRDRVAEHPDRDDPPGGSTPSKEEIRIRASPTRPEGDQEEEEEIEDEGISTPCTMMIDDSGD